MTSFCEQQQHMSKNLVTYMPFLTKSEDPLKSFQLEWILATCPPPQPPCKQAGEGARCHTPPAVTAQSHTIPPRAASSSSSTAWGPHLTNQGHSGRRHELFCTGCECPPRRPVLPVYSPAPHADQLPKNIRAKAGLQELNAVHFSVTEQAEFPLFRRFC